MFVSALASCSKDIISEDNPSDIYTFALSDDGTRAVLAENARGKYGHWESGDRLGTAVASSKPGYSFVNVGTPSTFSIYRPGGLTAGETLFVYYPYNAATQSVNAVQFEIPEGQYQTGSEFDFDAMPMAAVPNVVQQTVTNDKYTVLGDIYLNNLAAMAEFKIFSSDAGYLSETVTGVRFEADKAIAGAFSKDISAIAADDESSLEIAVSDYNWIETTVTDAPALGADVDGAFRVYMVLAPGVYSGAVIITTDKAEYTYKLSNTHQFKRSVIRSFGVDLASGSREAVGQEDDPSLLYLRCYEVPALSVTSDVTSGEYPNRDDIWYSWEMESSMKRAVTHTFAAGGKRRRTYTVMFDGSTYCPVWVACAMHAEEWEDNNCGRNNSWTYDPAIPEDWQQSGLKNATSVGYSRGHFVASNYRQTSDEQNKQTFYYTNQAPQWQNSFNGGIWASLEGAVKSAAPSGRDTLYVTIGILFEGETKTLESNDGKMVPIPSHFYKCVMKCSFDAFGNMTDAKGAAYIFTNEAHGGSAYGNFITTIDAIEQRSGFDFFPRVPADIQEAAESAYTAFL